MALRSLMLISKIHNNQRILYSKNVFPCHKFMYGTEPTGRKSIYKTEEAKKIRFYVLDRYFKYLKKYVNILEKKFPGAMRVYRVFIDGTKDFFHDIKLYIKIVRILNIPGNNLQNLKLSEIELYHQMPKDMRRVAPVLLISALPLANYIIFPVAYYFPRHLLCRHFWNLQQKHLQLQLKGLKCGNAKALHKTWSNILGQLGSGAQPTVDQILECKDLFNDEPYHLLYLSGNHIKHLIKLHDLHPGWFRRTRLAEKAIILQAMDRAILREGGLNTLSNDVLKNACLIRGLNPMNMRNEDMVQWMTQWITISNNVDKECSSLLLHCPILLGYNQPSNWQLLYSHKNK